MALKKKKNADSVCVIRNDIQIWSRLDHVVDLATMVAKKATWRSSVIEESKAVKSLCYSMMNQLATNKTDVGLILRKYISEGT